MVKRLLDLVISLPGLVIMTPFFLLFGCMIKLDSAGPVFYVQERVGKNGHLFKLIKFRTMRIDADKSTAITVGERDGRITRVGFILRKYKLDELAQLFNVLKGEMSLVGPRPELKRFVDLYQGEEKKVIGIKPGITDYASIQFSNENELLSDKADPVSYYVKEIMPVKLALNLKYIREQSFLLDIKIIFQTLFLIIRK